MENISFRPTRLEINLDNLKNNIQNIRKVVSENTLITAVVKSNAYGHGVVESSKVFLENGADRLAVSTLEEGIELRNANFECPILLLNYVPRYQFAKLFEYELIPTIYNLEDAIFLNELGSKSSRIIDIHIKIDTGMSRLGFLPNTESIKDIQEIYQLAFINIEGIYSHFAKADEKDKAFTKEQFDKFMWTCKELEKNNIKIKIKHIANSAAILDLPECQLDMVRAGIILYGEYPSSYVDKHKIELKPAMELKSKISHIKELDKDIGIGYGHKYITKTRQKIATIPVGYGDGLIRTYGNKLSVSRDNESFQIVGNICMDQMMIDISNSSNINVGDDITIFGYNSKEDTRIDDMAKISNTINYEIMCLLSRRVPRVYIKENEIYYVLDYLV